MIGELAALRRETFPAGTEIFAAWDTGTCAFIVETGLVEIAKSTAAGDKILGYVGAGSTFGEMALIDGEPRMASATAIKDTVCLVVNAEEFQLLMAETDPVVRAMLRSLVSDVRSVTDKPAL